MHMLPMPWVITNFCFKGIKESPLLERYGIGLKDSRSFPMWKGKILKKKKKKFKTKGQSS